MWAAGQERSPSRAGSRHRLALGQPLCREGGRAQGARFSDRLPGAAGGARGPFVHLQGSCGGRQPGDPGSVVVRPPDSVIIRKGGDAIHSQPPRNRWPDAQGDSRAAEVPESTVGVGGPSCGGSGRNRRGKVSWRRRSGWPVACTVSLGPAGFTFPGGGVWLGLTSAPHWPSGRWMAVHTRAPFSHPTKDTHHVPRWADGASGHLPLGGGTGPGNPTSRPSLRGAHVLGAGGVSPGGGTWQGRGPRSGTPQTFSGSWGQRTKMDTDVNPV